MLHMADEIAAISDRFWRLKLALGRERGVPLYSKPSLFAEADMSVNHGTRSKRRKIASMVRIIALMLSDTYCETSIVIGSECISRTSKLFNSSDESSQSLRLREDNMIRFAEIYQKTKIHDTNYF